MSCLASHELYVRMCTVWRPRLQVTMDLQGDCRWTMRDLNARLKSFLEQVNRLQEANRRREEQISDWGWRNAPHSHDWSQQERTVEELRAQVRVTSVHLSDLSIEPHGTPNYWK